MTIWYKSPIDGDRVCRLTIRDHTRTNIIGQTNTAVVCTLQAVLIAPNSADGALSGCGFPDTIDATQMTLSLKWERIMIDAESVCYRFDSCIESNRYVSYYMSLFYFHFIRFLFIITKPHASVARVFILSLK